MLSGALGCVSASPRVAVHLELNLNPVHLPAVVMATKHHPQAWPHFTNRDYSPLCHLQAICYLSHQRRVETRDEPIQRVKRLSCTEL